MKRQTLIITTVILLLSGVAFAIWLQNSASDPEPHKKPPAEEDGNSSLEPEKESPTATKPRQGGVIDTGGQNDESNQAGEEPWISSDSGDIKLIEPAESSILKSGSSIRGLANIDTVSYRLIDDVTGVIATGSLKVVNGKFSGIFDFETNGTEGRLDIFSTLGSGAETNVIEVKVRFK